MQGSPYDTAAGRLGFREPAVAYIARVLPTACQTDLCAQSTGNSNPFV